MNTKQRDGDGDEHVAEHGHRRGHQAEEREVGAHAADVDGEERRDEPDDPAAVDRRARFLLGGDLGGERAGLGLVGEAELVEHGLVGLGRGVGRARS